MTKEEFVCMIRQRQMNQARVDAALAVYRRDQDGDDLMTAPRKHEAALDYLRSHPGTSYEAALTAVGGRLPGPSGPDQDDDQDTDDEAPVQDDLSPRQLDVAMKYMREVPGRSFEEAERYAREGRSR